MRARLLLMAHRAFTFPILSFKIYHRAVNLSVLFCPVDTASSKMWAAAVQGI